MTLAPDQLDPRGAGVARFPAPGGTLEWNGVDGGDGGMTAIGFRYALGLDGKSTIPQCSDG